MMVRLRGMVELHVCRAQGGRPYETPQRTWAGGRGESGWAYASRRAGSLVEGGMWGWASVREMS